MSGRNDGNSGSPETRRVTQPNESGDNDADAKGANQADGKADGSKSDGNTSDDDSISDIEVEREASGE